MNQTNLQGLIDQIHKQNSLTLASELKIEYADLLEQFNQFGKKAQKRLHLLNSTQQWFLDTEAVSIIRERTSCSGGIPTVVLDNFSGAIALFNRILYFFSFFSLLPARFSRTFWLDVIGTKFFFFEFRQEFDFFALQNIL